MIVLRFIFPFLFVRNWQSGAWEFSRARSALTLIGLFFLCAGICIAYLLQAPVIYNAGI